MAGLQNRRKTRGFAAFGTASRQAGRTVNVAPVTRMTSTSAPSPIAASSTPLATHHASSSMRLPTPTSFTSVSTAMRPTRSLSCALSAVFARRRRQLRASSQIKGNNNKYQPRRMARIRNLNGPGPLGLVSLDTNQRCRPARSRSHRRCRTPRPQRPYREGRPRSPATKCRRSGRAHARHQGARPG
jgi:hypothetical protein